MTSSRSCSLDPVIFSNWRWQPFLEHAVKVLQQFNPIAYPIPQQFLDQAGASGSKAHPIAIHTATWACQTETLRQVRAACVEAGAAASVLNLVINPSCRYDLPFFGADLVTLPSGHLLALDLQPVDRGDPLHTQPVWDRLLPIFERWKPLLPHGGPIPTEAEPYFSPAFLWARLPLDESSDELISSTLFDAFAEYLDLYVDLVNEAKPVTEERSRFLLDGQRRYTHYRAEKDPARGMLSRFHGTEWTEAYIHEVLFDLDRPNPA
ncbi:MAG: phycoerythrobilin:ferredoxin oxidoreductase [Synechococcaceae bacterium WB9_2_170]|nr:phycoerythrobilin:ferredoxin oxidoreductase [Synechococcaceae bacterium WB9_2_170]